MVNLCLVSLTASHYRKLIYNLLEKTFSCSFVFGSSNTSIKQLALDQFVHAESVSLFYFGQSNWYVMSNVVKRLAEYSVVIDDMGIFCLTSWINLIIAKVRKQKVYLWDHGWYGREGFFKKWVKRAYFGLADGAFIYGNYARDLMVKNGFEGKKLHVIHNSLDYDQQILLRNSLQPSDVYSSHFHNNHPVICFIGRLTPVKKLYQIIDALKILISKEEFYNVVFIGDGSEKNALNEQVLRLDLQDQVWFYGACYDEGTNAELLYNADLCVAPGNIGLTAMHAMMFGCPCISHNDFPWQMPEFEAIVDGETGAFFVRDNVESLANVISGWFSRKKNRRQEVREACFKEIDNNWNPYKQLEIIQKVLNE